MSKFTTNKFTTNKFTMNNTNKSHILSRINDFTYSLQINGEHNTPLYRTIQTIIKSSHYDYDTNTILFSAEKVQLFKHYLLEHKTHTLSHIECIRLIDNLSQQIFYLHKLGYGLYGFDINDILTIDGISIFCNAYYLSPLQQDNIICTSPITPPYFSNPEVFKLTTLPFEINYKCSYYSLGLLVVFSLLNIYLLVGNELKTHQEILQILEPLYNTKIYWFLIRCFDDDINNRKLLLI